MVILEEEDEEEEGEMVVFISGRFCWIREPSAVNGEKDCRRMKMERSATIDRLDEGRGGERLLHAGLPRRAEENPLLIIYRLIRLFLVGDA